MTEEGDVDAVSPEREASVTSEPDLNDEHEDGEEENGTSEPVVAKSGESVTNAQYKALKAITDTLTNFKSIRKGDENHLPSSLFKRVPNRRLLPDYYDIIKEPAAISTLKGKIQRKEYSNMKEPVRDFALIVHNAQVYNRLNSAPVRDVFELKAVFEEELRKLVSKGLIAEEDTVFPDLGEIPYATPEPDPVSEEDEEVDEEVEEDDDDEEVDDSDDERAKKGRKRGHRGSLVGRKRDRSRDEDGQKGNDERKRRGRPPRVDTPMEARIKAVLKGIRKPKDKNGNLKIRNFERLPDKQAHPAYYVAIKEPIAIDLIKRKSKRKKYQSLDHFIKDIDLMFKNAMQYNEDDSEIYMDAVELQNEAHKLADAERQKPDSEYMMEDGRLPLPDGILFGSELYKVGDWVHIQNPNDVTKPIVAQIYRTWQDPEGQKWINACWYYRPEQTVHQFEKHFFPNEVVKTGQYRDHQIEEIVDRCFVMFFTRYNRGRPRHLDPTKEVYVCEARYNEEKHKLNKIKTWASCLPDEVREKDYEMDLFDQPRKIKKVPSPLLHLLKDDQNEGDESVKPEWKHPNAPPIVGAIFRGTRDENQSPPPEPTPPPPPTPPAPVRAPSHTMMPRPQQSGGTDNRADANMTLPQQMSRSSPSLPPQGYTANSASPAPPHGHRESNYQGTGAGGYVASQAGLPQTPASAHMAPYVPQQTQPQAPLTASHPSHFAGAPPSQAYNRPQVPAAQAPQFTAYPVTSSHGPRSVETYVLSEAANNMIPAEVRALYPKDDQGRVLFFTTPPVDTHHFISGKSLAEQNRELDHELKYLAKKLDRQFAEEAAERKREQEARNGQNGTKPDESLRPGAFAMAGEKRDADGRIAADPRKAAEIAQRSGEAMEERFPHRRFAKLRKRALTTLANQINEGTNDFYKAKYGDDAEQVKAADAVRQAERAEQDRRASAQEEEMKKTTSKTPDVMTNFNRSPWKGVYKDDYDARY